MFKYLPKQWKLRIAGSMALLFALLIGGQLIFSVVLVLAPMLWPLLLPIAILALTCRILAQWRR